MLELTQEVERLQQQVADLGHNSKAFGGKQRETRHKPSGHSFPIPGD